jgi:hypothetical protein
MGGGGDVYLPNGLAPELSQDAHIDRAGAGPGAAPVVAHWHALLPLNLLADPSYDINLPMWDTFGNLKWDLPHDYGEFNYSPPQCQT